MIGHWATVGASTVPALRAVRLQAVNLSVSRPLLEPQTAQAIESPSGGTFTVNVPPESLSAACAVCGSKSGRDTDKFTACKLTARKAATVLAPTVTECPIIYECQVVHSNDVLPAKLADEVLSGSYAGGDFHRVYYGKILAAWAEQDAAELLAK